MKQKSRYKVSQKGYTLIETLVASAVMMVAIGAASSLSLSMVTQEEMSERTMRAMNHLENAAILYQLGFDATNTVEAGTGKVLQPGIGSILPQEPVVSSLIYTTGTADVASLGTINLMKIKLTYRPSGTSEEIHSSKKSWTGGTTTAREHTIQVIRPTPSL